MTDTITLIGNVATDPVLKTLPGGAAVAEFRLATTHRRYDGSSGAWVDAGTNFYTVSAYRRLGEHAAASLHRGERVIVSGRLKVRQWETDTARGTSVDIDAEGLGHDLMWGVSAFTKSDRSGDPGGAGGPLAASWAVPGADPAVPDWPATAVPASEDAAAVSAGSAAPSAEPAAVPF
ncbi:single-stranded DNA-binding protein [Microbacterium aureliae]